MANATGPAGEGFIAADFEHAASGIHYRITDEAGHVWLIYERNDFARMLSGRQELRYFLGSGKRGRTYLFERQGYWFEAPINWYAKKQVWDMAPNCRWIRDVCIAMRRGLRRRCRMRGTIMRASPSRRAALHVRRAMGMRARIWLRAVRCTCSILMRWRRYAGIRYA